MTGFFRHRFGILLACATASIFASCQHETGTNLGNGFLFVETDAYNAYVIQDGKAVVDTNVLNAEVRDEFIVGERKKTTRFVSDSEDEVSDKYGYFILDKTNGTLIEGLSETEFEEIFKEMKWEALNSE